MTREPQGCWQAGSNHPSLSRMALHTVVTASHMVWPSAVLLVYREPCDWCLTILIHPSFHLKFKLLEDRNWYFDVFYVPCGAIVPWAHGINSSATQLSIKWALCALHSDALDLELVLTASRTGAQKGHSGAAVAAKRSSWDSNLMGPSPRVLARENTPTRVLQKPLVNLGATY